MEPMFGQIKFGRGFRQFLLRGLEKVNGEWLLICTGHNLLKLFRFGVMLPVKTSVKGPAESISHPTGGGVRSIFGTLSGRECLQPTGLVVTH